MVREPLSDTNGSISVRIQDSSQVKDADSSPTIIDAPEKKLTEIAFRLAVLEKAATRLGTLSFIWATVVLLGGFAVTLENIDFWFVTVILLIEGTRIFGRSHELEWQQNATWSIADAGAKSIKFLKATSEMLVNSPNALARVISKRSYIRSDAGEARERLPTTTSNNVNVLRSSSAHWRFVFRNNAKLLNWIQLLSAIASMVLSVMRLIQQNYGNVLKAESDTRNRGSALTLFYSLALAEACLFLFQRVYWEWKVDCSKLLENVKKECHLKDEGITFLRRFFYEAYSRSVNGSIFDGLKLDMVSFAMDRLQSNSPDEQLIGAKILVQLAKRGTKQISKETQTKQISDETQTKQISDGTLQKIGINISVIERLVEMLNWKSRQQEEIRRVAAEILVEVASKEHHSLRVAGVPGAMQSISSLLYTDRPSSGASYNISMNSISHHSDDYYSKFTELGIHLLKKLARDHDNCGKIGNTRGLLPKIIDLTEPRERLLKENDHTSFHIQTIKRSLKLVKLLVSTTGTSGRHLRSKISKMVFTISNIREILKHGVKYPRIQELGIQILTSLALEVEAREMIGATGGVLRELLSIFFNEEILKNVRIASGEALAMLALESTGNCHRMINLEEMGRLMEALNDPSVRVNAARILWSLLTFTGDECFSQLHGITSVAPVVLRAVNSVNFEAVNSVNFELHEVMVGLAVHVFRLMTDKEISAFKEVKLAPKLVQILKNIPNPPIKVPGIRRFVVELAIRMMRHNAANIQEFRDLGMKEELQRVAETTAEIEKFYVFSGTVGVSPHQIAMHSLVETALKVLLD